MIAALLNGALFAGLTVALGAVSMRFALLTRCGLSLSERSPAARHAATGAAWAAALVLVAAPARALLQVAALTEAGEPWMPMLRLVLVTTSLGKALQLQAIWAAAALMAFSVARMGRERGWIAATIAVAVLSLVPALSGHAAAAPHPTLVMTAATLHVLAAGIWIGGLFHIWRSTGVASDATLLLLLRAFHAVALTAATVLIVSGGYQTWVNLGPVANLFGTPWGLLLVAKQILVLAVLAFGYRHWRRAEAAVTDGTRDALRTSLGREFAIAAVVLAVTAVLTTTATPP